ncbi:RES family NAD+ phosphorylase [Thiorhodococcus minor]|uniref:RES family NAD+ phosphorylase n=1 Tax=Thiorhodococcus minor TaxID=57489 RepID=A0A6M0JVD6_9GAMM|nr:RES family NAD+ phosphorylase [Thiorhodococcus minor]NEV61139.1 RES family NAD+ phosphorylase [Thiorhodococcus minor]
MILCDLPPGTTLFRAHAPQWASRPISGAGAAIRGGRFNREGVEALYLSLDEVTALREYQQTSPFLPPCTMCSYTVALRDLVDLRQLHDGEPWDDLWHDWREDWRHLKFERHIEPPTWVLADLVLAHGHTGILFPSQAHEGGTNVVVYSERLKDGNSITVNDPDGRLPRNMSSWAR